jgi:adenine-specific DNA methylase
MVQDHPIICPNCKEKTGFIEEQFRFYLLTNDVCCPHCGHVVLPANKVTY